MHILPHKLIAGTDIAVSPIGFGTVKLGRDQGVKYPNGFSIPDDQTALNLISLVKSHGINLIDTAPAYGVSEVRVGELLKGQRQDWILSTKAGEEFENGQSHYQFDKAFIIKSVERSLKRLKTDYLDIVMIHSNGDDLAIIEEFDALDTLNRLKAKGMIRATGMSTKTVEGGIAALKQSDIVMATLHLGYDTELPVIAYAHTHHKGIFIKKALASGHLCVNDNADPVKTSFEYIFKQAGVSSAVIGSITPSHIQHNISIATQYCL